MPASCESYVDYDEPLGEFARQNPRQNLRLELSILPTVGPIKRAVAPACCRFLTARTRLTLASLSAVVSANLRVEFKREGWPVPEAQRSGVRKAG